MTTLRRLLPSLAALLAVLVVVQTTDLVACADEALAAETGETHTDARVAQGGHDVPAPGDRHDEGEHEHEEGTFADCLCHVVFTPTGIVPDAGVRPASDRRPTGVGSEFSRRLLLTLAYPSSLLSSLAYSSSS